jgi:hypothetical protein
MIYECKKCPGPKTFEEMAKDSSKPSGLKNLCKKHESERINSINKKSKQIAKEVVDTVKRLNLEILKLKKEITEIKKTLYTPSDKINLKE